MTPKQKKRAREGLQERINKISDDYQQEIIYKHNLLKDKSKRRNTKNKKV